MCVCVVWGGTPPAQVQGTAAGRRAGCVRWSPWGAQEQAGRQGRARHGTARQRQARRRRPFPRTADCAGALLQLLLADQAEGEEEGTQGAVGGQLRRYLRSQGRQQQQQQQRWGRRRLARAPPAPADGTCVPAAAGLPAAQRRSPGAAATPHCRLTWPRASSSDSCRTKKVSFAACGRSPCDSWSAYTLRACGGGWGAVLSVSGRQAEGMGGL